MINYRNNPELFNIVNNITKGSQLMVTHRFNSSGEYTRTKKPVICKVVAVYEYFCTVEHRCPKGAVYYEDINYTDLLSGHHRVYNY